jgi:hypothetical protein
MTTAEPAAASTSTQRLARAISEVLSPVVVLPACTFIVSVHASKGWLSGLAQGGLAVFFAVGFPYAILLSWVRSGRLTDREIRDRHQRPTIMLITLASVTFGLAALSLLHVPAVLLAHMAAMVAGLAATLFITTRWKISIHTACLAGAITSLSLIVAVWALVAAVFLAPLVWSRKVLGHHTIAQALAGVVLGASTTFVVLFGIQK